VGYSIKEENNMGFKMILVYLLVTMEDAIIFFSSILGVEPGNKRYPLFLSDVEGFLLDKILDLDPNGESNVFNSPFEPLFRLFIYNCPELFDLFVLALSVTGVLFLAV
jgi:hypothetical protein